MAKGDMSEDDSCKSHSLSTITIEKSPDKYVSNPVVQVKQVSHFASTGKQRRGSELYN